MKALNMMIFAAAMAVSIGLTEAVALADEAAPTANATPRPGRPKLSPHAQPVIPAPEPMATVAAGTGFATASPQASTLSPPVTLTYSGSSNALTVTDSGTGRGISSTVTNSNSGSSALFGRTVGTGAGLTGYNSGTSGPGGKFEVTNANSEQPGAFASTSGIGNAIMANVTNTNNGSAAVYGVNTSGNEGGGVAGSGSFYGVYGISNVGYAVWGESESGTGVYALLENGTPGSGNAALYVEDDSATGAGSYAVYGSSNANTTAYFTGGSAGNGYCSFSGGTGWNCSSDKNLKKDFVPVDGTALLEHLAALPVFEYSMKGEHTATRYVGPTAQDFMSAFHLGDNDTLINTANAQGVALAAAKGLYEKVKHDELTIKRDEVEIATLKRELAAQTEKVADMAEAAAMAQGLAARIALLEEKQAASVQTAALITARRSLPVATQ